MGNTNLDLRPHQVGALNQLRRDWKKYNRHMLYSPVGSGKTAMAAEIAGGFLSRGMRVLFIVPYVALMEQTARAFVSYGLPQAAFIWQDHELTDPNNPLQIASADTLIRRSLPDVDVVIVDEAHLRKRKLFEWMGEVDTPFVGLSATPFSKFLGAHYQNLIKVCSTRQLIDEGYLSDFDLYAPTKPDLNGVTVRNTDYGSDYVESEVAEIMGDAKLVGNVVSTWLDLGQNRPTIAFCCNVSHANYLTVEFIRNGVAAEVMVADTPFDERRQIIRRFEDGITKIICNVGVLVAGFDSDVRCIVYARPTTSEMRWIQCIGRGLRTAPGKDRCIVLDHSGTSYRLGLPDQIEIDELPSENDGMTEQQRKAKEKEKAEKLPKECTQCHYMKPPGQYVCAKCGHKPIGGEDVDADESRGLVKIKGEKKATKEDKQDTYSQLLAYQREREIAGRPVSDGWVAHKYKARHGVWPKGLSRTPKPLTPELRNWIKGQQIRYAKGMAKKFNKNVDPPAA